MSINTGHPDYVELRSRIRENPKEFVAILGAGLSRPCGLPSWVELRDIMVADARSRITDFSLEEQAGHELTIDNISNNPNLWQCFSELKRLLTRPAYESIIKESLKLKDRDEIPEAYDLLWSLNLKGVVTFNIDTCALDSHSRTKKYAVDTASAKDIERYSQFIAGQQDFVFQPHGNISDSSTWVFTNSDKQELLSNATYISFMKTLCQSKHLIILGFNPQDFAFEYLLQHALFDGKSTGSKHYIFLPNARQAHINELGDKGIAVIGYTPEDHELHEEIITTLKDFNSFVPEDDIPASVYTGKTFKTEDMPDIEELIQLPVDDIRDLLNGAISNIIPQEKEATKEDIEQLEEFYKKYLKAIHMAWLIEPGTDCDLLHKHKVLEGVGRGAFGQVYKAQNIENNEIVAVKVLLPEVRNNREYLNSFRRGVRSIRILTENLVPGMVKFEGAYEVPACVLMEFIDGPTLTKAMEEKMIDTLEGCLEILFKMGEIVHCAHELKERVLHRDLKPDNIMLKNFYHGSSDLEVIVLDFDLSWHKGALDMSVVHGARAQGYAAPEQTATGLSSSVSTRHTAVDVFGLGMIAYFLFSGNDPRPNEQNFIDFEFNLKKVISKRYRSSWRSIPTFLANLVRQCTFDAQDKRIAFSSATNAFKLCHNTLLTNTITADHPLFLLEIAVHLEPDMPPEISDFGRDIIIASRDTSKKVRLLLKNINNEIVVNFTLTKVRAEHEQRNVAKYLDIAKDRAIAKIKGSAVKNVKGEVGHSRLDIYADLYVPDEIYIIEIEKIVVVLL